MGDNVVFLMQNGLTLERQGRLRDAEVCFTDAIRIMQQSLASGTLGQQEHASLQQYMTDTARRIQRIREVSRANTAAQHQASSGAQPAQHPTKPPSSKASSTAASPRPTDSTSGDNLNRTDAKPAVDPFDSMPKIPSSALSKGPTNKNSTVKQPTPPAPSPPPPPPPTPPQGNPGGGGGKDDGKGGAGDGKPTASPGKLPPPSFSQPNPISQFFAPKTSELVLKAIDIAAELSKKKEHKRAVDVLQHAYSVGKMDRNNPTNFKNIEAALVLLRKEYYSRFKPRFLQDNPITPQEMEILRKSGITTTILLPIWDDIQEGYGAENVFMPCEGLWNDNFTPRLSVKQHKSGARMVRASEIKRGIDMCIIKSADPLNIKQTVVGDCSMVCSLIVCASYQMRFPNAKIINNVIFPQDLNGNPIVNPKGKYCVKMLVNGMTRLITVDDFFPANPRTGDMLCTYSKEPSELWVSIMEKAFVKVCGGSYDFPGSSSSSDLYKMSGWLPDGFDFTAKDFNSDVQWNRLAGRHADGSVLITLSTPETLPDIVETKLKLFSGHAYAVLEFREVGDRRLVQIKNPWSVSTWTGLFSMDDQKDGPEVLKALGHTQELADQGVFWMGWGDVQKYFHRCNLSWNPYMLFKTPEGQSCRPTRLACHDTFKYTQSTGNSPQFHVRSSRSPKWTRMHVVLSRHITDVSEFGLQFQKDDDRIPYLALQVYNVSSFPSIAQCLNAKCKFGTCYCRRLAHGTELSRNLVPVNTVIYRNMAAQTVSFDCPPGDADFIIVVSCTKSAAKPTFNFSVTLHTDLGQMKLSPSGDAEGSEAGSSGVFMHAIPECSLKHHSVMKAAWVRGVSCGGKSDEQTFVYNPQYLLTLSQPSLLSVRLCVPTSTEASQVQLAKKRKVDPRVTWGSRIADLSLETDLLMQAPLYAHGGCGFDSALPASLVYDTTMLLGPIARNASGSVVVKVVGREGSDGFTAGPVPSSLPLDVVYVAALARGIMLAPNASRIVYNGNAVDTIKSFSAQGIKMSGDSPAEVVLVAGPKTVSVSAGSAGVVGGIAKAAKAVEAILLAGGTSDASASQKISSDLRELQSVLDSGDSVPDADAKACFVAAIAFLTYRLSSSQGGTSASEMLPTLPAGSYTIIPSLWSKGVAEDFQLTVETTQPHQLEAIPQEGEGFSSQVVQLQLRSDGVPLQDVRVGTMGKNDPYFQMNPKINITTTSKGILVARALELIPNDSAADSKGGTTSTNIALFRSRDQSNMACLSSSGPFTRNGAAIDAAELDSQNTYILVISSKQPSSARFAIRLYYSGSFTAKLT